MSEHPIIDTLSTRKPAPPTATLRDETPALEAPALTREPLIAATPRPEARDLPTVGSFFAEHRAVIDARKDQLSRVGMLPQHVNALAMPDLVELPRAPAVNETGLAPLDKAAPKPRKMPEHGTAATTDTGYDGTQGLEVE